MPWGRNKGGLTMGVIGMLVRTGKAHVPAWTMGTAQTLAKAIAFRVWQARQWAAYHAYSWPLREVKDLTRLLEDDLVAPTCLCGCEFTGAMRNALARTRCTFVLSVDTRESNDGGMHFCGEVQLVLEQQYSVVLTT